MPSASIHNIRPLYFCRTPRMGLWLFSLLLLLLGSNTSAGTLESYKLAADDQISITVFGEPELSLSKVRISPNGTISMHLIGQIRVAGLTAAEVEKRVATLLADGYLRKPGVTVSIAEYRLFYVIGEVKKPGGYGYRDGLTVHKAVSLAGGFSERADRGDIIITHEGSTKSISDVKLTDRVRPGDVINVKESFF